MTAPPVSLLIDSNIFIAAEAHGSTDGHQQGAQAAELLRLASRLNLPVWLSHGTRSDLMEAPGPLRAVRARQLEKYHVLDPVTPNTALATAAGFPPLMGPNDRADLEVLSTFHTGAADWLVTNDTTLRKRARRADLGDAVYSLDEALDLLRRLFSTPTALPTVSTVFGYTVPLEAPILRSLREAYPPGPDDAGFDAWWRTKVAGGHREAIILGSSADPEGIAVPKMEDDAPHGLTGAVLKICTFRVADDFAGTKRGELLLKAVIDYARRNHRTRLYVEVLPSVATLPGWLEDFGFTLVPGAATRRGEVVYAKVLQPAPDAPRRSPLEHTIAYGPGSALVERVHLVPIQDRFHHRLLPEADPQIDLLPSLEPCGNAIRKAYLCHAKTRLLQPGDLLLFLRTGAGGTTATSAGVVEQTLASTDPREVIRFVGARTVYSSPEITSMCQHREVLAIRFRLDRVLEPSWGTGTLRSHRVMTRTPQSIAQVPEEGVRWIASQLGGSP